MKNYWSGVTYRTNKTIMAMAGIRLGDNNTRRFRWLKPDVSGRGEYIPGGRRITYPAWSQDKTNHL